MPYLQFNKTELVNLEYSLKREVIRTNRAGSYHCTTIIDCNTRKYHGLLICPLPQVDNERHVLLSTIHETVIQHEKEFNLGLHKYEGDNYEPKGHKYIRDFTSDPIPRLLYRVGGVVLSKEKVLIQNDERVLIKYTLLEAHSPTKLRLKPFLAFRNIHALSKANLDANTRVNPAKNGISSRLYSPYPDLFIQISKANEFIHAPDWYYNIEYLEEQKRGYEYKEDLFAPGYFEIDIKKGESIIVSAGLSEISPSGLSKKFDNEVIGRTPRDSYDNCLTNAVNQFFVQQNNELYIMAGYPWLPVRARDTFISLPGLTLCQNTPELFVKAIKTALNHFNGHLLPELMNSLHPPHYTADTPLWMIWAIQKYGSMVSTDGIWKHYGKAIKTILEGYLKESTYFSIDDNGLIFSYTQHQPCSWMTGINRHGYLVETNALWYNAIAFCLEMVPQTESAFIKKWSKQLEITGQSFLSTFWNNSSAYLADYVDYSGKNFQVRPNQIIATSLPYTPLNKEQIKGVVDVVKQQLLAPVGIRTLAPHDPEYKAKYKGNHFERETAAYNGCIHSWLMSFYVESLVKLQPKAALRAADRFFTAIEPEIQINGLCTLSELYHSDPPHNARGAISYAMNVAELLRVKYLADQLE